MWLESDRFWTRTGFSGESGNQRPLLEWTPPRPIFSAGLVGNRGIRPLLDWTPMFFTGVETLIWGPAASGGVLQRLLATIPKVCRWLSRATPATSARAPSAPRVKASWVDWDSLVVVVKKGPHPKSLGKCIGIQTHCPFQVCLRCCLAFESMKHEVQHLGEELTSTHEATSDRRNRGSAVCEVVVGMLAFTADASVHLLAESNMGSKPMVPFWGRCITHFGMFTGGTGF